MSFNKKPDKKASLVKRFSFSGSLRRKDSNSVRDDAANKEPRRTSWIKSKGATDMSLSSWSTSDLTTTFAILKNKLLKSKSSFIKFADKMNLGNPSCDKRTLYHLAAEDENCLAIIKYLWRKYRNPQHLMQHDMEFIAPCNLLARHHGVKAVDFLLENVPFKHMVRLLTSFDASKKTMMELFAINVIDEGEGFRKLVKMFGQFILQFQARNYELTPFLLAAMHQNKKVMRTVARQIPNCFTHAELNGSTMLHYAIYNPSFEAFKMIVKACGPRMLLKKDKNGKTAEMYAKKFNLMKQYHFLQQKKLYWNCAEAAVDVNFTSNTL